jgi:hypothetical protein
MAFIETTPEGDASGAVAKLSSGIVDDATSVSEADVERLRRLGLSDDEIFDVAAAAAARCFFSKTLDALDAQPDAAYAELDQSCERCPPLGIRSPRAKLAPPAELLSEADVPGARHRRVRKGPARFGTVGRCQGAGRAEGNARRIEPWLEQTRRGQAPACPRWTRRFGRAARGSLTSGRPRSGRRGRGRGR